MEQTTKKIAIVGGGAAGMMCAFEASQDSSLEVHLFEKNAFLGHKVQISGGGRCNVTTGLEEIREVLKRYPRGNRFLKHAFYEWTPQKMLQFMEEHGVPMKIEKDLRAFPVSDDGKDVVKLFERILSKNKVQVHLKTKIEDCEHENSQFILHTSQGIFHFDALVLSTGGQAYQHTGSTGDAYTWAKEMGHSISALAPSLNAFVLQEDWIKKHSGVSFENVKLSIQGEQTHSWQGPALITHKGITGPACFALSSLAAFENYAQPLALEIDFVPHLHEDALREVIQKNMQAHPKQSFIQVFRPYLPKKLAESVLESVQVDPYKESCHVSKEQLRLSLQALKRLKLHITGRSAGDEFVTAGGVLSEEIDPKSMESLLVKNLYFAGEIINADGFTGGFNLHNAWATGALAGKSLKAKLASRP